MVKHWVYCDMEVIIDFLNLGQVFVLHFSSCIALIAWTSWVWEYNLVYHDVFDINLLLCQLNSKTFSFIHTEKFWNTNSHKGSLLWIFKLSINFINFLFNSIKSIIHFLVHSLWISSFTVLFGNLLHGCNHTREFLL